MEAEWALVCWTAGLTIATVLLAIVAAFQDSIRSWFWSPKLNIEIEVKPPDCHIAKSLTKEHVKRGISNWHTYYFRFKIMNDGRVSAKNVEVILKNVKNLNGEHINLSLDNLKWNTLLQSDSGTFLPTIYWKFLSPNTYQYCNLGYIIEPEYRKMKDILQGEDNPGLSLEENETLFAFSVYWRTLDLRYLLQKGKYNFEVVAGCENGKSISKKYEMEISGFWSDDEKVMLSEGFKIKEI